MARVLISACFVFVLFLVLLLFFSCQSGARCGEAVQSRGEEEDCWWVVVVAVLQSAFVSVQKTQKRARQRATSSRGRGAVALNPLNGFEPEGSGSRRWLVRYSPPLVMACAFSECRPEPFCKRH